MSPKAAEKHSGYCAAQPRSNFVAKRRRRVRHQFVWRPTGPLPRLRLSRSCFEARGALQLVCPVRALPGEGAVAAAEVAVGGGGTEDRAVQVQVAAEGARAEVELRF